MLLCFYLTLKLDFSKMMGIFTIFWLFEDKEIHENPVRSNDHKHNIAIYREP